MILRTKIKFSTSFPLSAHGINSVPLTAPTNSARVYPEPWQDNRPFTNSRDGTVPECASAGHTLRPSGDSLNPKWSLATPAMSGSSSTVATFTLGYIRRRAIGRAPPPRPITRAVGARALVRVSFCCPPPLVPVAMRKSAIAAPATMHLFKEREHRHNARVLSCTSCKCLKCITNQQRREPHSSQPKRSFRVRL